MKLVIKSILAGFLFFLDLVFLLSAVSLLLEDRSFDSENYDWKCMHEYAADGNYPRIFETLTLHDYYEETYQDLWTLADAYWLHCQQKSAENAAELTENPAFSEECSRRAGAAKEELSGLSVSPDNRTVGNALNKIKEME